MLNGQRGAFATCHSLPLLKMERRGKPSPTPPRNRFDEIGPFGFFGGGRLLVRFFLFITYGRFQTGQILLPEGTLPQTRSSTHPRMVDGERQILPSVRCVHRPVFLRPRTVGVLTRIPVHVRKFEEISIKMSVNTRSYVR